jgi:hypothetical protein
MQTLRFAAIAIGLVLATAACAERAPLDGKSCPCAAGERYVCCGSSNRCQSPEEACGGSGGYVDGGAGGTFAGSGGYPGSGAGGKFAGSGGYDVGQPDAAYEDYGGQAGSPFIHIDGGYGYADDTDAGTRPPLPPLCTLSRSAYDFEWQFIVPTCGKPPAPGQDPRTVPACHNGSFAPRLDDTDLIGRRLVSPSAGTVRLTCKSDPWINLVDWSKSYVLTKTNPSLASGQNAVACLFNAGKGMLRMPASDDANPSKPLTPEQWDCLRLYVFTIATGTPGF